MKTNKQIAIEPTAVQDWRKKEKQKGVNEKQKKKKLRIQIIIMLVLCMYIPECFCENGGTPVS